MRQKHIYSRYDSFKLPFAEAAIVSPYKNYIMDQDMLAAGDELAYISVFSRS